MKVDVCWIDSILRTYFFALNHNFWGDLTDASVSFVHWFRALIDINGTAVGNRGWYTFRANAETSVSRFSCYGRESWCWVCLHVFQLAMQQTRFVVASASLSTLIHIYCQQFSINLTCCPVEDLLAIYGGCWVGQISFDTGSNREKFPRAKVWRYLHDNTSVKYLKSCRKQSSSVGQRSEFTDLARIVYLCACAEMPLSQPQREWCLLHARWQYHGTHRLEGFPIAQESHCGVFLFRLHGSLACVHGLQAVNKGLG